MANLLKIYSVFDTKTSTFSRPFYEIHDHQAKRGIAEAVRAGHLQFPQDYVLMCLGTWDDGSGSFTSCLPVNIGSCDGIFSEIQASRWNNFNANTINTEN